MTNNVRESTAPSKTPYPIAPIGKNGSPSQESPSRNGLHTHFLYHKLHTLFQTIKFYSYSSYSAWNLVITRSDTTKSPHEATPLAPAPHTSLFFHPDNFYIEKPDTTRQPSWSQGPRHNEIILIMYVRQS